MLKTKWLDMEKLSELLFQDHLFLVILTVCLALVEFILGLGKFRKLWELKKSWLQEDLTEELQKYNTIPKKGLPKEFGAD